jgi:tetratricopeptide (TPR) repeat protein
MIVSSGFSCGCSEWKGCMLASTTLWTCPRTDFRCRTGFGLPGTFALFVAVGVAFSGSALAADRQEIEDHFRTGRYDECVRLIDEEIATGGWNEPLRLLKIKSQLARGKYPEALASLEEALTRFPASISLHLLGRDVYRLNGNDRDAGAELFTIDKLIQSGARRYATPEGFVTIGRFFLIRGTDARKVLDQFYDVVTKQKPDFLDGYYATAELALEKEDYALAAETLRKAPKAAGEDPRFHYLLASALSAEDRAGSAKALGEALKINPHHGDSLLLQADQLIDGERYKEADQVLKRVLDINPLEARAWAYRAVMAHLRGDHEGEVSARSKALAQWSSNPEVNHLIGRKLSQKYRFAEGAALQKLVLGVDPDYLPAKIQLCQDLLRLGEETEGWKLAAEIFSTDGYNVVAYNLITLRDRLAGFQTLEGDGFVVRMDKREADLYGPRVLALLSRARKALCEKFGVTISQPVIVEIFPQRKEFAVRTFGLPGADGLLGVCFGRVITANSPASQGDHPANWEAVLWHEFCHVVTLSKTHNKMPRWLSEGISVHEEGLENPAWGMALSPRFRAMILSDALTPLSQLSSAFLAPKTGLHLQFAYFESALAVDFLVQRCGLPALKSLLDDLGSGISINESLPRRTKMSLEQLDKEFAQFARQRAEKVAPGATWEEPEDLAPDANSAALTAWLEKHPQSFEGLRRLGTRLVVEEKWQKAKEVLERVKTLYPEYVGPDNPYLLLAIVFRRLSDPAAEHKVLEELAMRDGDAVTAYLRLMELDQLSGDWGGVAKNGRRFLAVNPLVATPHRQLARAAEHLGNRDDALTAYRAVALLDDTDPAEVHYHLAKLLREAGKPREARLEVLKSLEEAPRFREAHQLLLELVEHSSSAATSPPADSTPKARKP